MNCPKCGVELPDNSTMCSNCGEKLANNNLMQNDYSQNVNNRGLNQEQNGFSITSLVLAIASIICFFINGLLSIVCSILAIIFGAIGRKKGAKGLGTAGMVIGIIVTALIVIVFIFVAILAASVVGSALNTIY